MKDINKILKISKHLFMPLLVVLGVIYIAGCSDKGSDSVWPGSVGPDQPIPIISSYSPTDFAYSGVSKIIITGQYLAPRTTVFFTGGIEAPILSASENEVIIEAPVYDFDAETTERYVAFKIQTGANPPSDSVTNYLLRPAVLQIPKATTRKDNRFLSLVVDKNNDVILLETNIQGQNPQFVKITGENEPYLDYAPGNARLYNDLRIGPDGQLYGVRNQRAVFVIPEGAGNNEVYSTVPTGNLSALEFDQDGNLWTGSSDQNVIYKIDSDKNVTDFSFTGIVNSLRVYVDGGTTYLYVNVKRDNASLLVRMPIVNGALGAEEQVLDFSAEFAPYFTFENFNFSTDGTLYLATGSVTDTLIVPPVHFKNESGAFEALYPALLAGAAYNPTLKFAAWGTDDKIYYIKETVERDPDTREVLSRSFAVVRVSTQKQTAPFYGRDL